MYFRFFDMQPGKSSLFTHSGWLEQEGVNGSWGWAEPLEFVIFLHLAVEDKLPLAGLVMPDCVVEHVPFG